MKKHHIIMKKHHIAMGAANAIVGFFLLATESYKEGWVLAPITALIIGVVILTNWWIERKTLNAKRVQADTD